MSSIESIAGTRPVTVGNRKGTRISVHRFTVVVKEGPDAGHLATLDGPSLCIGTDPECECSLTDSAVSRRHAVLTTTPAGIRVEDLESTNGTFIEGVRIASAVIPEGGCIRVGGTVLEVRPEEGSFVCFPDPVEHFAGIVGGSRQMAEIVALVKQLARTDLPVLVTGETGTGKELIGRALHDAGPRKQRPFQVLDCGAIVADLLRAELFGHERGAFTGAERATAGILEEASGGTVFLDEIGEIDLSIQPQLLRALETRSVTRIGSRRAVNVDFRIVAATNRDLKKLSAEGRFRPDLYYRMSCVTVRIPSLRERREDIPAIASHFATACAQRNGIESPRIEAKAIALLKDHGWPGNVRELKNVIESSTVLSEDGTITADRVRAALEQAGEEPRSAAAPAAASVSPAGAGEILSSPAGTAAPAGATTLAEMEKAAIEEALRATSWNRRAAARRLGIPSTSLHDMVRRYGLTPPQK